MDVTRRFVEVIVAAGVLVGLFVVSRGGEQTFAADTTRRI